MKIRLGGAREVKVDDDVHGLDVDTTREEICHQLHVQRKSLDPPEQTRFRVIPFRKSWKTLFRCACSILAWE